MIQTLITKIKKAESGQSIIILAIAFIFLLAFVGLTTDVSLMFVRYATIRRAVDSASIAAATQMRQGTDEAAVAIAARQFIEFHGLDAINVKVDTCQTLNKEDPDVMSVPEQEQLRKELCTDDQRKLVKVTVQAQSPTVFLRLVGWNNFTLQASAISETAALDVVLIMDVSESMLTETSYDDWARIGMGFAYVPPKAHDIVDYEVSKGFFTPGDPNNAFTEYVKNNMLSVAQATVNSRLWYASDASHPNNGETNYAYGVKTLTLDTSNRYDEAYGFPANVSVMEPRTECRVRFWPWSTEERVASYKGRDVREGGPIDDPAGSPPAFALQKLVGATDSGFYNEWGVPWDTNPADGKSDTKWDGFVPSYDFYGCCNDPGTGVIDDATGNIIMSSSAADKNFQDLICQPFKGARDAVELFLDRIDFIRGDRVAFVTFDRSAFLINPYNEAATEGGRSHMIDNYQDAKNALRGLVGVRSEPNFYVWDNDAANAVPQMTAHWDQFAAGIVKDPSTGIVGSQPVDYGDPNTGDGTTNAPQNYNYPVKSSCAVQNAALDGAWTLFGGSLSKITYPYPALEKIGQDTGSPKWKNFKIFKVGSTEYSFSDLATRANKWSYELYAACRGTNIGAALREANNALLDPNTSRRFGAIWVMILLGDGAAGASDPVRRTDPSNPDINGDGLSDAQKLSEAQPYACSKTDPITGVCIEYGIIGDYGAFGVCPYGTTTTPAEVTDTIQGADAAGPVFPWCSDESPETRHDCDFRPPGGLDNMQDADYVSYQDWLNGVTPGPTSIEEETAWNVARNNLFDVDIGTDLVACSYYDVDDYARDWADFIGVQEPGGADELLPTIFTIGFGLTYNDAPISEIESSPEKFVGDYLGEQMLRYIADIGDNNKIDNDFYQDYLDEDLPSNPNRGDIDGKVSDGFGFRDACQDQTIAPDPTNGYDYNGNGSIDNGEYQQEYAPLPPRVSCGNYFNAPNADELQLVFDSIASRMFTRLAG